MIYVGSVFKISRKENKESARFKKNPPIPQIRSALEICGIGRRSLFLFI